MNTMPIEPNTIYAEGTVSLALDIPLSALARARRRQGLRFRRMGQRVFYKGSWLLEWFEAGGSRTSDEESVA